MIDLTPNITVLYQAALLIGLWLVLRAVIFDRTTKVLEEREEKTRGALSEAQRLRSEATSLRTEYDAAIALVRREAAAARDGLRKQAEGEERSIVDGARQQAAVALERARAETARQLAEARATLEHETVDLANRVVLSVLQRN